MNKIYIVNNYVVYDDGAIIDDGELLPVEIGISDKMYDILISTKDFKDIDNYVYNRTDYFDNLLEIFDTDVGYEDTNYIKVVSEIEAIYKDEDCEEEILATHLGKDSSFIMKSGVFILNNL